MTISDPANTASRSLSQDALSAARYYLGSRAGLVAIAVAALGLGAYFNWGWLVAAGIAPLLIGVAPCAAMCALGLCMTGRSKNAGADQAAAGGTGASADTSQSLRLSSSNAEAANASPDAVKKPNANREHKGCC